MVQRIDGVYTIVWHFDGTTLTSSYETEELRDEAFEQIAYNIKEGILFHKQGDTILNVSKVLCITKGEDDKWNCPHVN